MQHFKHSNYILGIVSSLHIIAVLGHLDISSPQYVEWTLLTWPASEAVAQGDERSPGRFCQLLFLIYFYYSYYLVFEDEISSIWIRNLLTFLTVASPL